MQPLFLSSLLLPLLIDCETTLPVSSTTARNGSDSSFSSPPARLPYYDDLYFAEENEAEGPRIVRHSHFTQHFRLGYALRLMCESTGNPLPRIIWYKNGAELVHAPTLRIRERHLSENRLRSSLAIDPATLADKGIYGCLASNEHGFHLKSMKAVYAF